MPAGGSGGGYELVYNINKQRPARVERPKEQIGSIVRNMGEKALAVLDNEKLTGYILVSGNGDTVCELGLLDAGIMEAVIKAYLAYTERDEIEIVASAYDKALNQRIGRFAESYCVEPSEMFQIFDFANVLEAYLSLKQKTLGLALGEFSAVLDGQPVTVWADEMGFLWNVRQSRGLRCLISIRRRSSCFQNMAGSWMCRLRWLVPVAGILVCGGFFLKDFFY